ncbi:hypothetical protein [Streptomyces sp. NPDC005859]
MPGQPATAESTPLPTNRTCMSTPQPLEPAQPGLLADLDNGQHFSAS